MKIYLLSLPECRYKAVAFPQNRPFLIARGLHLSLERLGP